MKPNRPPIQKEITCTSLGSGIYQFAAPPVGFQQYLILGQEHALLIDSGMGIGSLRKEVEKVTSLPIILINTHGHPDHAGGNAEFPPALMCPKEFDVFQRMATYEFRLEDLSHMPKGSEGTELQPTGPAPVPAEDGALMDLGGRVLQVLYTPGHTHGSICIYDQATGALFTGDNAMAGRTSLCEWNSGTVKELHDSLLRMMDLHPTVLYGGHRPNCNPPELLQRILACTEQVLAGAQGTPAKVRGGGEALVYEQDGVSICYTQQNIR